MDDALRHLIGAGRFTADQIPGESLEMVVVRAPIAHGTLEPVDPNPILDCPGIVDVLVAEDPDIAALAPLRSRAPLDDTTDGPMREPDRPVLARGKAVYLGQPIAAIIAETEAAALDALDAVALDISPLPPVVDLETADQAPPIWDIAPDNVAFRWEKGNGAEVDAAFADADHVVSLDIRHPRLAASPLETRSVLASHDAEAGYALLTGSQGVVSLRAALAECLGEAEDRLHVRTRDVGGSFAVKIWPYPEHVLSLVAARRTGRPVRWTASRGEALQSDVHGRARLDRARLALDKTGRILAFDVRAMTDLGAFLNTAAPVIATTGAVRPFGQAYDIPAMRYRTEGRFTNLPPTDAFRGASKPESAATLERLIDCAAVELGMDRLDLRRRNLIRPEQLPYPTPMGETYDAGDFPRLADAIAEAGDWAGLAARKTASAARGLLRGAGVSLHVHATGGSTVETSEVSLLPDGRVRVRTGAQDSGQGHRRALATLAAEVLEIPVDRIVVEQGDSANLERGGGTGGSNLLPVAGNTLHRAAGAMLDAAREKASEALEVAGADLVYGAGTFAVTGTDRRITLTDIAADGTEDAPACLATRDFEGVHTTFPNGAYMLEVEIDPETGNVHLDRLTGLTDAGRIVDPVGALGQIQGGIAQGIGEALMEAVVSDADGQLLSGSLMDYQLPRAADMPALRLAFTETASPNSLLGVKGLGELPSIGTPSVVMNAVMDALSPFGIRHIDKPVTAAKIWAALQNS